MVLTSDPSSFCDSETFVSSLCHSWRHGFFAMFSRSRHEMACFVCLQYLGSYPHTNWYFEDEIISSLSPWKVFLLVPAYVFGALPSFVLLRTMLRREYVIASKAYRTLATRISSLSTSAIVAPVLIYAFQGFVLAFSYCVSAGLREQNDPRLAPFAPTT